jgi:hypothetical protein
MAEFSNVSFQGIRDTPLMNCGCIPKTHGHDDKLVQSKGYCHCHQQNVCRSHFRLEKDVRHVHDGEVSTFTTVCENVIHPRQRISIWDQIGIQLLVVVYPSGCCLRVGLWNDEQR